MIRITQRLLNSVKLESVSKRIFYLSGAPGSGKTTIVRGLRQFGFEVIDELVHGFPLEVDPDPRSFETAQQVFIQNVKRNTRLQESENEIVIVDRHPLDCLLIAKGLLQNDLHFRVIEDQYQSYPFTPGYIIRLELSDELSSRRSLDKPYSVIDETMLQDIHLAYQHYNLYLQPHHTIHTDLDSEDAIKQILEHIRIVLVQARFRSDQPSHFFT